MSFRFPNSEKLKNKKTIDLLFEEGKTVSNFPLKLFYLPLNEGRYHQVAFAVPKRNFRLAVSRNRIKRQMREAYRLHKHMLSHDNGKKFALLFLYISKDKSQYAQLDSSVKALLKKNSL
jgi:ribonuclease P protein component